MINRRTANIDPAVSKQTTAFSKTTLMISLMLNVGVYAQDTNPAQSVLQQKPGPDYRHLTEVPEEHEKSLADRCSEMLRKVEELKGKPQRRSTAMARYRAECERP